MKNFAKGLIVVALSLVIIPLATVFISSLINDNALPASSPEVSLDADPSDKPNGLEYELIDTVLVYDTVSMTQSELSTEQYLVRAVLGTLSPYAHDELIKAQSVLMYTYILGRRLEELDTPTPELHGCDISTDTNLYFPLVDEDSFYAQYGDEADELVVKVTKLVQETMGEYLSYDESPIVVAFCFSCGGRTESASDVLGEDVPYLKSVSCEYDADYTIDVTYSKTEVFARVATKNDAITLLGDPSGWIVPVEVTGTGYVKQVLVGSDNVISGATLASWLNLPSARFTVSYSDEFMRFTFKVSGNGNLLGLSQYGANEMANRGWTYDEILMYFFSDTQICKSA